MSKKLIIYLLCLFGGSTSVNASFIVDIYDSPTFSHTNQLRDYMSTHDAVGSYQYQEINFSDWGNKGFFGDENLWPIAQKDTFSAHITGVFDIPEVGNYDFASWSDDGVQILIDGVQAIFRPNPHAPTLDMTSLFLSKGIHTLDILWYENYGAAVLEFSNRQSGSADWQLLQAASISDVSQGSVSVPEPSIIICMTIGLLMMGWRSGIDRRVAITNR